MTVCSRHKSNVYINILLILRNRVILQIKQRKVSQFNQKKKKVTVRFKGYVV